MSFVGGVLTIIKGMTITSETSLEVRWRKGKIGFIKNYRLERFQKGIAAINEEAVNLLKNSEGIE